MDSEMIEDRSG